ncbi:MAG: hypothetical protein UIJ87_01240 [Anaerovoracaceae bacterium]|nr:hypothetical protein [Anaerovoracaceae bacterium]
MRLLDIWLQQSKLEVKTDIIFIGYLCRMALSFSIKKKQNLSALASPLITVRGQLSVLFLITVYPIIQKKQDEILPQGCGGRASRSHCAE